VTKRNQAKEAQEFGGGSPHLVGRLPSARSDLEGGSLDLLHGISKRRGM
jgi:hypothetical protein